jgi:putative hemolysin
MGVTGLINARIRFRLERIGHQRGVGMQLISRGKYTARQSVAPQDIKAAQRLRYRAFLRRENEGGGREALDVDAFDEICTHILIETVKDGQLACVFRILPLASGAELPNCYSAQYYDLSALESFEGGMLEIGRFCTDPDITDPNVLRCAWAALTRYVDANDVALMFGCSSFAGTNELAYDAAFALLAERHIAPKRWMPQVKAPRVFDFSKRLSGARPDRRAAFRDMPPLLRTYLAMGGWVSDHAVVDDQMDTLHVFTGVEVARVPGARAQRLRIAAQG